MATWPTAADLNRLLNTDSDEADEFADIVEGWVAAAINRVKLDVGDWDDDVDEPDENLAAAALRMAELIARRPEAVSPRTRDLTYLRLIFGHRRRFGIA